MSLDLVDLGTAPNTQTGDQGQVPFAKVNACITQVNTSVIVIATNTTNISANTLAIVALEAAVADVSPGPSNTPGYGAEAVIAVGLSGSFNDFNPTGFTATTSILYLSAAAGIVINSIAALGRANGSTLKVVLTGAGGAQFNHQGGGTAANQFRLSGQGAIGCDSDGSIDLFYDTLGNGAGPCWRVS